MHSSEPLLTINLIRSEAQEMFLYFHFAQHESLCGVNDLTLLVLNSCNKSQYVFKLGVLSLKI